MSRLRATICVLLVILTLVACSGASDNNDNAADLPTALILPTLTNTPNETPVPLPTPFVPPTVEPTATNTPTIAPTNTAVIIPTATLAPTLTADTGNADTPGLVPAAPSTSDPTLPFAGAGLLTGILIDLTVAANLSALSAVDAVTPHALANTPAVIWTGISGSGSSGWEVEFYDESADTIVTYRVATNGEVRRQIRAAFGLMPGFPLDRTQITVDSDRALELAAADGPLPEGDITLALRSAGDDPAWTISGANMVALVPATGG